MRLVGWRAPRVDSLLAIVKPRIPRVSNQIVTEASLAFREIDGQSRDMKRWPVVCVFAWAVAAAMAADASLSELAPPGTAVTIGINVRRLLDSPLATELGAQDREFAGKLAAGANLAGLDPFKDVDQVWILVANLNDKSPALVVVRGRFDVEKLAAGAKRYKDVPLVEGGSVPGGVGGAIGLLSDHTAIAGEKAQVQAAIDRLGSEHVGSELEERIAVAGSRYDVWGIGEIPMSPQTAAAVPGIGPNAIDRFMFGLALRQGLAFTAELHARSTEDAAKITALLSGVETALKAQKTADSPTLDVQSEDGTFRITATMTEEQLRKAIANQRAAALAVLSQSLPGNAAKTGAQPAAPETAAAPAQAAAPAAPETPAAPPPPPAPATAQEMPAAPPPPPAPATAQEMPAAPPPSPAPATAPETPAAPPPPPPPPPPPTLVSPQPATVAPPPAAPKPPNQAQIIKAPNGDTMILKLPGAK